MESKFNGQGHGDHPENGGGGQRTSRFLTRSKSGEKNKTDEDGNKIHGMGIMCSLRKLTPPKKSSVKRSVSGTSSSESQTATTPSSHSPPSTGASTSSSSCDPTVTYFCPALNCYEKLSFGWVLDHAKQEHALVISTTPDCHASSVEVSQDDLGAQEGSAAWAPTLLRSGDKSFFFETWRNGNGKWFMWVYQLGSSEECSDFLADIVISHGQLQMSYSGPVFSLSVPQTKITNSGFCLSFTDTTAQTLLQELKREAGEEGGEEGNAAITGICYRVNIRKNDMPQTFSGNLIATKF